jgi:hypothetical protein
MGAKLGLAIIAIFILTLFIISMPLALIEFASPTGPAELPSLAIAMDEINIQIILVIALLILFLSIVLLKN